MHYLPASYVKSSLRPDSCSTNQLPGLLPVGAFQIFAGWWDTSRGGPPWAVSA